MLLSELKESKLIKAFVMGEPGTGKTIFASSFPGPIKFFDFDGKVSSAYSFLKKNNPEKLKEIDFEACVPSDGIGSAYAKMDAILEPIVEGYKKTGKLTDGKMEYKTLVIDSSTIMAEDLLNWLLNFEKGIKRNTTIKSRAVPGQQDYLIFAPTFSALLYELLPLPWNVVMTGHISVKQDEKTGEIRKGAAIPGRMSGQIGIYFNEVYRSFVQNGQYMAQTQADLYYACRTQVPGLPNPTQLNYENISKHTV